MKSCEECKFCVLEDNGYSNWTVEGTTFTCAEKAHPDGSFDRFYGEDDRLKFAEKCRTGQAGDAIHMDVDHESESDLTPAQREIFLRAGGKLWRNS